MFSCMKISCTFCRHLGPQIINLMNTKNEPNDKNKSLLPFQNGFYSLQKKCIIHYLVKCVI